MNKIVTFSLAVMALGFSAGMAKALIAMDRAAAPGIGCMTETASININYNSVESDVSVIKEKVKTKAAEIEKLFKDAGLSKVEMQSTNYSISPTYGNTNTAFNYSGSMNFNLQPSDKATDLLAELIKKGYQASVNVSSYRNGTPCGHYPSR